MALINSKQPVGDEHSYLREAINITPDWEQLYTPARAEKDLEGFKFQGPGWYYTKDDTILVLPSPEDGKFWFWVYNERNPAEAFNQIVNAPVREPYPLTKKPLTYMPD